jgi:hypothetical protein
LTEAFCIAFIACLPVIFAAVLVIAFFWIIQIFVDGLLFLCKLYD